MTRQNHNEFQPETLAVRAGIGADSQFGAITPPIYLSSNFSFAGFNQPRDYDYTRSGNPTRDLLGQAIADLEGGAGGVVTSTGMSAICLVLQLLKAGERILVPHDCYGGSSRLFRSFAERGLVAVDFVDQGDLLQLSRALAQGCRLVWIETPSNPLLRVVDINKIVKLAKAHGALVVVDNTFLSPLLQKPLELGADLVVHSTTKYINGHSDVVGGAVVAKQPELYETLKWWANCIGVTASPFDCFLTLRGLRSLDVRIKRHESNAQKIAHYLSGHPQVEKVYYPGLLDHDSHAIAAKQQQGFGAMIAFSLTGGKTAVERFLKALELFCLAESLGGVESLICHPATMTHAAVSPENQAKAGITDNLLRLSVGIEQVDDLIADLEAGFAACQSPTYQDVANG